MQNIVTQLIFAFTTATGGQLADHATLEAAATSSIKTQAITVSSTTKGLRTPAADQVFAFVARPDNSDRVLTKAETEAVARDVAAKTGCSLTTQKTMPKTPVVAGPPVPGKNPMKMIEPTRFEFACGK